MPQLRLRLAYWNPIGPRVQLPEDTTPVFLEAMRGFNPPLESRAVYYNGRHIGTWYLGGGDWNVDASALSEEILQTRALQAVSAAAWCCGYYYGWFNLDTNTVVWAAWLREVDLFEESMFYGPPRVRPEFSTIDTTDVCFSVNPLTLKENTMIKLDLKREGGKLVLLVNAKELHDDLDAIGVPSVGNMYSDRPSSGGFTIADARTHTLSTEVLLRRGEYPARFELTGVYATPPSYANLKKLCESAYDGARKILEHYQPIDISVEIQKKLVG